MCVCVCVCVCVHWKRGGGCIVNERMLLIRCVPRAPLSSIGKILTYYGLPSPLFKDEMTGNFTATAEGGEDGHSPNFT